MKFSHLNEHYIKKTKELNPSDLDNEISYDFSIVIPTRERWSLLIRCLDSIKNKSSQLFSIEVILLVDSDDIISQKVIKDFQYFNPEVEIKLIIEDRQEGNTNSSYYQKGFGISSGRYLWSLGNDCEIITEGWDEIVKNKIENFVKNDRICYCSIDDDLHSEIEAPFCCFPILTREVYNCLSCCMPIELPSYGADFALWNIFSKINQNRVLDIRKNVIIKHYASYTGRIQVDNITKNLLDTISKYSLNECEENIYINKLNSRIK